MQRCFLAAPVLAMLPTILKTLSAWEKKKILSLYPLYIHHWHIIIFSILKLLILLFLWETHQSNTNIFSNFLFKYNQGHIIHSLCGNIYIYVFNLSSFLFVFYHYSVVECFLGRLELLPLTCLRITTVMFKASSHLLPTDPLISFT